MARAIRHISIALMSALLCACETISRIELEQQPGRLLPAADDLRSRLEPFLHDKGYILASEFKSEFVRQQASNAKSYPEVEGVKVLEVWDRPTKGRLFEGSLGEVQLQKDATGFAVMVNAGGKDAHELTVDLEALLVEAYPRNVVKVLSWKRLPTG